MTKKRLPTIALVLLLSDFWGLAADSRHEVRSAVSRDSKVWVYRNIQTTNAPLSSFDERYRRLTADGWVLYGYSSEPAWGGGASRPARYTALFRKPNGWNMIQRPDPALQRTSDSPFGFDCEILGLLR